MKRIADMSIEEIEQLMKFGLPSMIQLPESIKEELDPELAALIDARMVPLFWLPSLNGKGVAAFKILLMERLAGNLPIGSVVVVPSSGNTVVSIAFLKRHFGLRAVIAVIEKSTDAGKQDQIWKAGAEIMYPDPERKETAIEAAKRIAQENGWILLNQYDHEGSWLGHYEGTVPHIMRETHDEVSVICAAAGTTSMIYGAEKFCLDHAPQVNVLGVASMSDEQKVPGSRSPKGLEEVGFPYRQLRIPLLANTTKERSYRKSLSMVRDFVPVGPTGGLQVDGSLLHFQDKWEKGEIGDYLNAAGKLLVVYVGMDMHLTYNYREVLEKK